jgi:phospholipid/cholesterol/gamma-HCH transport system substrate-binding protein
VKIAGVKVGKIREIQFRASGQAPIPGVRQPLVRIAADIEKRYQQAIHENALVYVTTQGVLGEQFLAIDPGSSDRNVLPEDAVVRGLDPPRLDMLLAEGYELLHTTVAGIRENRQQFGEAFDGLRKTLVGTGHFFDQNGDRIDRIAENVETMSIDGRDMVKGAREKYVENPQIDRILSNVDATTSTLAREGPPLVSDARASLENVRRITDTVGAPEQQAKLQQTMSDVAEVASRAKAATADAEQILAHVKRGKGTAGAVVMDERLYDDLQEMVRDLKHNPWKFFWRE